MASWEVYWPLSQFLHGPHHKCMPCKASSVSHVEPDPEPEIFKPFPDCKTSGLGNFALSGITYPEWWLNPVKMVILMIVYMSCSCFSNFFCIYCSKSIQFQTGTNLYCSKSPHWCILSFSWGTDPPRAWNPCVSQTHFWCIAACNQEHQQEHLTG